MPNLKAFTNYFLKFDFVFFENSSNIYSNFTKIFTFPNKYNLISKLKENLKIIPQNLRSFPIISFFLLQIFVGNFLKNF